MKYFLLITFSSMILSCAMMQPIPVTGNKDVIKNILPIVNKHYGYVDSLEPDCKINEFYYVENKFMGTYSLKYRKGVFLHKGKIYPIHLLDQGNPEATHYIDPQENHEGDLDMVLTLDEDGDFSITPYIWNARKQKFVSQDLFKGRNKQNTAIMSGSYYTFSPGLDPDSLSDPRLEPFFRPCRKLKFLLLEIKDSRYKSLIRNEGMKDYILMSLDLSKEKLCLIALLKTDFNRKTRIFEFSEYLDVKDHYELYPVFELDLPKR